MQGIAQLDIMMNLALWLMEVHTCEVFMISWIIKIEVGLISWSQTLTETLIILDMYHEDQI